MEFIIQASHTFKLSTPRLYVPVSLAGKVQGSLYAHHSIRFRLFASSGQHLTTFLLKQHQVFGSLYSERYLRFPMECNQGPQHPREAQGEKMSTIPHNTVAAHQATAHTDSNYIFPVLLKWLTDKSVPSIET